MKIEIKCTGSRSLKLSEFVNFQGNLKELSDVNYQKLKESIIKYGFSFPVIVWKNNIIDGHQRIYAIKKMVADGFTIGMIPVADILAETKMEAKKKLLLFNSQYGRVSEAGLYDFIEESGLDFFELKDELDLPGIELIDFETGFYNNEDYDPESDQDDEIPEEVEEITDLGDLYEFNGHRLLCGDSCDIKEVKKLIDDNTIDMIYTDPPYGTDIDGDNSKRGKDTSLMKGGLKLKSFIDDSIEYAVKAYNICEKLKIKVQVWWGANYYSHHIPQTNNWLVWDKRVEEKMTNTNSDCELAYVKNEHNSVRIFRHLWNGLLKASEKGEKRVHPTQKPVALAMWAFDRYFKDAGRILDLFGGSGSTLIACEKTNRWCYMMELDPHYCDVIIERYKLFCELKGIHCEIKRNGKVI